MLATACGTLAAYGASTVQAQQSSTTLPPLSVETQAAKKKQATAKPKQKAAPPQQQAAPAPAPTTLPTTASTNPGGVTGYQATRTSSGTKTDTPLLDIPQAISVVTKQQIEDQSAHSLADVVRYIPGIQIAQGEGHRDAPIIRGQASTADLFLNGIRDDRQYYRDFYNIDHVEVLRGPNAMIFGRGSGGSVINRASKEAGWSPFTEVSATLGTFGERRATDQRQVVGAPQRFDRRLGNLSRLFRAEALRVQPHDHLCAGRATSSPTSSSRTTARLTGGYRPSMDVPSPCRALGFSEIPTRSTTVLRPTSCAATGQTRA